MLSPEFGRDEDDMSPLFEGIEDSVVSWEHIKNSETRGPTVSCRTPEGLGTRTMTCGLGIGHHKLDPWSTVYSRISRGRPVLRQAGAETATLCIVLTRAPTC